MAASTRSILRALVGACIVALGALLLLELSARVFLFGPAGLHPLQIDSVRPLTETGFLRRTTDPGLHYELEPGIDGYFKLKRFRTNSRGMRDREHTLKKPPDTFRIAVMGSSFALAAGVEIEDGFHSVLEERLRAGSSSLDYEILNFGVSTYRPAQALAMLRLRALAYDPDLVIFAVTKLSTPLLQGAWNRPVPFQHLDEKHAFYRSFFFDLVASRLGRSPSGTRQGWIARREAGLSVIQKLGELSRETGIPVVVVRFEHDASGPSALDFGVAADVRRNGLHFLDTREAFEGSAPRDFWIYELDVHPNARAHAIFANVLETFLRENGLAGPDAGSRTRSRRKENTSRAGESVFVPAAGARAEDDGYPTTYVWNPDSTDAGTKTSSSTI